MLQTGSSGLGTATAQAGATVDVRWRSRPACRHWSCTGQLLEASETGWLVGAYSFARRRQLLSRGRATLPLMNTTYHLTPEAWFRAQSPDSPYLPEAYAADGYVHLTHGLDAVLAAGNRYYTADPRPYLLLTVEPDQLSADVRYDDPARQFPHVYGPLELAAITCVERIERDGAGRFVGVVTETPDE